MAHITKRNKRVRSGGRVQVSASLQRAEGKWIVHYGLNDTKEFLDEDYKPGKAKRHAERFLAKVS